MEVITGDGFFAQAPFEVLLLLNLETLPCPTSTHAFCRRSLLETCCVQGSCCKFCCVLEAPEGLKDDSTHVFVQGDHSGIDSAMGAVTGKHEL